MLEWYGSLITGGQFIAIWIVSSIVLSVLFGAAFRYDATDSEGGGVSLGIFLGVFTFPALYVAGAGISGLVSLIGWLWAR